MPTTKAPPIFLFVGNAKYVGFSSLQFTKELTGVVHGFALEMTDINALEKIQNVLTNDVLAQVYLGANLLTVGYIDSTESGSDLRLRISGRSKASRLVDCSAPKKEYNKITIQNLAQLFCSKYGILFSDEVGITNRRTVKSGGSDSPLELMKKWLEESKDAWLMSSSTGDIVLKNRPNQSLVRFEAGINVYSYSISYDYTNVFSDYTVYSSQHDSLLGNTSYKGSYHDDYIKSYKNKSIESNFAKSISGCISQAKKAAIAAKSRMMTLSMEAPVYVVDGILCDVGDKVTVTLPAHSIENRDFVINRLTLDVSASSFKQSLELIDASSFNDALKGSDVLFAFDGAFARAFHAARIAGQKTFLWRGKRYHTHIVEEMAALGLGGG